MGFKGMNSVLAQPVDVLQVLPEHIWVLIIFVGYVLFDCFGEGYGMGPPER